MKVAGNGRKGLADRRGDNGELFGGELDGLHLGGGVQRVAEQLHAPKAAEPQDRQVPDPVNYETPEARQEQEAPIRPVSLPDQMPVRSNLAIVRYPLLEALLAQKGLPLKGIWTLRDVAKIFDAAVRTIQDRIHDGKLIPRDLPGRGRFLSEDLEGFLQKSARKARPQTEED